MRSCKWPLDAIERINFQLTQVGQCEQVQLASRCLAIALVRERAMLEAVEASVAGFDTVLPFAEYSIRETCRRCLKRRVKTKLALLRRHQHQGRRSNNLVASLQIVCLRPYTLLSAYLPPHSIRKLFTSFSRPTSSPHSTLSFPILHHAFLCNLQARKSEPARKRVFDAAQIKRAREND